MNKIFVALLLLFAVSNLFAQVEPQIQFQLNITNNESGSRVLKFGVDPTATDSIDIQLGEANLPPFPPLGELEARYILPEGDFSGILSSYNDFRTGSSPFTGEVVHRLKYQIGSGDSLVISWDFPPELTGRLQDIILGTLIDTSISGAGSFTIPNPAAFDQLKFTAIYNNVVSGIKSVSTSIPETIELWQNYPNPFNPSTIIKFSVKNPGDVNLNVFNTLGKVVKALVKSTLNSGNYSVEFDGSHLSSGVYFYQLKSGSKIITKKMLLIK